MVPLYRCPARHRQRRGTGALEVVWAKHNHGILERRKRGSLREILLLRKKEKQQLQSIGRQPASIRSKTIQEQDFTTEYLMPEVKDFVLKNE